MECRQRQSQAFLNGMRRDETSQLSYVCSLSSNLRYVFHTKLIEGKSACFALFFVRRQDQSLGFFQGFQLQEISRREGLAVTDQ
ncbi:hypothetical protein D7Y13_44490 [Corallococcus praedator]|uniref:Uncharacterized protein n=1 Tax=Corallococcus praedator TaxID=2316724 RepID=A0ABX9Q2E3_9BACT|nr:hypothetical protein D7Y13_44490 [Corallococcus praedator]